MRRTVVAVLVLAASGIVPVAAEAAPAASPLLWAGHRYPCGRCELMTNVRASPRRRLIRMLLPVLVLTAGTTWLLRDGGGTPKGDALEDDGGIQGAGGPVLPGEPLTFGLIHTENRSSEPVELVGAWPLRVDPDLELLGFTARPAPNAPATAREHPVDLAVPLDEFPVLEPGDRHSLRAASAARDQGRVCRRHGGDVSRGGKAPPAGVQNRRPPL